MNADRLNELKRALHMDGLPLGKIWKARCAELVDALDELEAEVERLTVGRATLEDQTNRAELAEARVKALEDALRQYADPTNWGIERDEFKYPRLVWIGPGAAQRVPDGISLARAVLVLSGGSE